MFQIFCDSAANIPAELVKKYNINVLSFVNDVEGKMIPCFDINLTPEQERAMGHEYYEAMRKNLQVKTALVNTDTFTSEFRKVLEKGEDVIYFSLSKNISGTYNAARIAAEDLLEEFPGRKIRLVDSLNASLAQGILAIYASEMRDQGKDIDSIADYLDGLAHQMNGVFTVDDLRYLSRTGRIKTASALIGNALNLKPILRGNADGYIVQFSTCRGRKKALRELVRLVCDNALHPEEHIMGIAHADCYEESLYVMEEIQKHIHPRMFINTSYDMCTGTHVGPDTVALFFVARDRELSNHPITLAERASDFAEKTAVSAEKAAINITEKASTLPEVASELSEKASEFAEKAATEIAEKKAELSEKSSELSEKGSELTEKATKAAAEIAEKASDFVDKWKH